MLLTAALAHAVAADEGASSAAARAAYASAAALQNREAWDLAAEEWQALVAAHPDDPLALEGRYYLAICQAKNGQWAVARQTLEAVLAGKADAETKGRARWELARGDFTAAQAKPSPEAFTAAAAALRRYLDAAAGQPRAAEALHLLGESLWQAGNRDEALATWRRFLESPGTSPRLPDVLYALGVGLAETGSRDEAAATLARFARDFPRHPLAADVALWRADLATAAGRADEAEKILAPLAAANGPKTADALERLGEARWARRDRAGATEAFSRLVREFPEGPGADVAWYRLGQIRQDGKDFDAAIDAFAKSVSLEPQGHHAPWALLATGWCRESQGRLDEAVAAWTRLVDEYPKSTALAMGLLARADARQRHGDFAGGLADVRRVLDAAREDTLRLEPDTAAEARLLEGLCLAGEKQYGAATAAFRRLLEERPAFPAADRVLCELALAQLLDGRADDAAATCAALARRFPQSGHAADAWLELGEARWATGDWAAAAEAYGNAIGAAAAAGTAGGPVAEQARHKLGWTFIRRDDRAAAAREFAAQVEACPAGALAADGRALLGESLLLCDKVDEAGQALDAALADASRLSSPELRGATVVRAAEVAARRGEWRRSLEIVEGLVRDEPQSPQAAQARYAAAWARQNLGELDEALAGYRAIADAARTETAARARLMEGEVLFEQGDHREAIKAFFKAAYGFGEAQAPTAFHPWQAQATYEAARCFEVLRKPEQARKLYAELVDRYPDSEHVAAARKRLAALPAAAAPPGDAP